MLVRAFALFCLLEVSSAQSVDKPLKVSVYYEGLCGDSVNFIRNQLQPAYDTVKDYLLLDFVPYGKASQWMDDGKWKFSCQHGISECDSNKLQACAFPSLSQDQQLQFVSCVIGSRRKAVFERCYKNVKLDGSEVADCIKNGTGDRLLAKYGDRTNAVEPQINFVPTIVFNDVYNWVVQDGAMDDFLGTACDALLPRQIAGCRSRRTRLSFW